MLTHWDRVTQICVTKLAIIGSDNGLSPGRHQAIIWTNAGILWIWPLGTNVSEILIEIRTFSFKKWRLKLSSGKWLPFCLGLNVILWMSYHTYSESSLRGVVIHIQYIVNAFLAFRHRHTTLNTMRPRKWTPFRRRHFQMHFLERKCLNSY